MGRFHLHLHKLLLFLRFLHLLAFGVAVCANIRRLDVVCNETGTCTKDTPTTQQHLVLRAPIDCDRVPRETWGRLTKMENSVVSSVPRSPACPKHLATATWLQARSAQHQRAVATATEPD